MCRHVAAVGRALSLSHLLEDAPYALVEQARAPRFQTFGRDNPDGWGVAWYSTPAGFPARYRTVTPMWRDDDGLARVRAQPAPVTAVLAAARYATPGFPRSERNTAPYVADRWTFSHNGAVDGFGDGAGRRLRDQVSAGRYDELTLGTDSETLFALALDALDRGAGADAALAHVVACVRAVTDGRLNLLLCDGATITATAAGNSLFARVDDDTAIVASEPLDDDPRWQVIADGSLVVARPGALVRTAL